jgi:hypothetical protein
MRGRGKLPEINKQNSSTNNVIIMMAEFSLVKINPLFVEISL